MKKLLILSAAFVIGFSSLNAQEISRNAKVSPEQRSEQFMNDLNANLDLSKKQQKRIAKINSQFTEQLQSVKTQELQDPKAKRQAMKTLRVEHQQLVKAELNEKQAATFEAMNAQKKAKMQQKRGMKKGKMEGQKAKRKEAFKNATPAQKSQELTKRMTKQLNLSANQVTRVQAINLRSMQKMEAVKNSRASEKVRQEQRRAIKAETKAELSQVLNTEQLTKLKAMKDNRRPNPQTIKRGKKQSTGTMNRR